MILKKTNTVRRNRFDNFPDVCRPEIQGQRSSITFDTPKGMAVHYHFQDEFFIRPDRFGVYMQTPPGAHFFAVALIPGSRLVIPSIEAITRAKSLISLATQSRYPFAEARGVLINIRDETVRTSAVFLQRIIDPFPEADSREV
jgi:hypothetical protein